MLTIKTDFDVTRGPIQLIYRTRTHLDDFGVDEELSLNNFIYEILYEKYSHLNKFEDLVRRMFNAAYYICTTALADRHADRRFGRYLDFVYVHTFDEVEYQGVALAITLTQIRTHLWDSTPAIKRLADSIERELKNKHADSYKEIYIATTDLSVLIREG